MRAVFVFAGEPHELSFDARLASSTVLRMREV
jgi:hypothetical protein